MMPKPQIAIPATYMRGGTSKGLFFVLDDLPAYAREPGPRRDALLLRVIGSPDPYGKQTDGMGGATSSTSKIVILSKSEQEGHDVDYLFGQVSIDKPFVDWSGNCGNLTAAVGAFAIRKGLIDETRVEQYGHTEVRIWQANINKTILASIPMSNGQVQETGSFELDGVTFPAAEVQVSFLKPGTEGLALFPTGKVREKLNVPELGEYDVSYITAGIPTVFLQAEALGFDGTELQGDINSDNETLNKLESIRAHAALAMGLISDVEEAKERQHTPKIAWAAGPKTYTSSSGKLVEAETIDLNVRAMSMGQLHHAMMGTAAVAISVAASIEGTIVNQAGNLSNTGGVRFGHPSGTLKVGAVVSKDGDQWCAEQSSMSRSARVLMEGQVFVPEPS